MALNETAQIEKLLEGKKNILIAFGKENTGDAIASAIAIALFLDNKGIKSDIVSDTFSLPNAFKFLPKSDNIKASLGSLKKFIITIDTSDSGVEELSYDTRDNLLRIFVTPKKGFIRKGKVEMAESEFTYDLIITVGTADMLALGEVYTKHTEFFHQTPLINIDNNITNEHFGQVNVVDATMTATTEVIFDILQKMGSENIDSKLATAILTGIISRTRSFKTEEIKPHTLETAGRLVKLGASRELIVNNLYRTRSIAALKLWGQALSQMQHDPEHGLVWSSLTRDDLVRSGASHHELSDIFDELISNSPDAKITVLLHEDPDAHAEPVVHGILRAENPHSALELSRHVAGTGNHNDVKFTVRGKSLKQVESEVVEGVKTILKK